MISHEYEMEDPACAWIDLVESCHQQNIQDRKVAIGKMLFLAKNSHWTMDRWIECEKGYASGSDTDEAPTMGGDADQGGDYIAAQHETQEFQ